MGYAVKLQSRGGLKLIASNISSTSFDVASVYSNYKSLTADDFILEIVSTNMYLQLMDNYGRVIYAYGSFNFPVSKSYNNTTGILSINNISGLSWQINNTYGSTYGYCKPYGSGHNIVVNIWLKQ